MAIGINGRIWIVDPSAFKDYLKNYNFDGEEAIVKGLVDRGVWKDPAEGLKRLQSALDFKEPLSEAAHRAFFNIAKHNASFYGSAFMQPAQPVLDHYTTKLERGGNDADGFGILHAGVESLYISAAPHQGFQRRISDDLRDVYQNLIDCPVAGERNFYSSWGGIEGACFMGGEGVIKKANVALKEMVSGWL